MFGFDESAAKRWPCNKTNSKNNETSDFMVSDSVGFLVAKVGVAKVAKTFGWTYRPDVSAFRNSSRVSLPVTSNLPFALD